MSPADGGGKGSTGEAAGVDRARDASAAARSRRRDTADRQLSRLLWLIPAASRPEGITVTRAAEALGVTPGQIRKDIQALTERAYYYPAGTAEGVSVEWVGERFHFHTTGQFSRPPRLTRRELLTVVLGLRLGDGDHGKLRNRLEGELSFPGDGTDADADTLSLHGLEHPGETDAIRPILERARSQRMPCVFGYLKPDAPAPERRRLHCYALVHAEGHWYAAGWDPDAGGLRTFRTDRILELRPDSGAEPYEIPPDFNPATLLDGGTRLFKLPASGRNGGAEGEGAETEASPATVVIRYGPGVATWVRERWVGEDDEEGGYRVEHPLADPGWAVRHVLGYGAHAEIVEPCELRELVRDTARRMCGETEET